jgi:NADH:ubiquinone oxidoreductase subunit 6 (subunit J)
MDVEQRSPAPFRKVTNSMVFQIVSLVGAVLILFGFAAQQLRRLDAATMTYQSLNFVGGACLWIAAAAARQYGFILLEGTWTIMSAYGVWRVMRVRGPSSSSA